MVYVTINTYEVDNLVQRLAEEPAWNLDPAERGQLAAVLSTMHRLLQDPAAVAQDVDSDPTGSFSISVAVEDDDGGTDLFSAGFVPTHWPDASAPAIKIGGPEQPLRGNDSTPAIKIGGPQQPVRNNESTPAIKIGGPQQPVRNNESTPAIKIGGPGRPSGSDDAAKIGDPRQRAAGGPGVDEAGRA